MCFWQARELELFYDQYLGQTSSQTSIQENQCIVFANVKSKTSASKKARLCECNRLNRFLLTPIHIVSLMFNYQIKMFDVATSKNFEHYSYFET